MPTTSASTADPPAAVSDPTPAPRPGAPRLLVAVRAALRSRHYSRRTEQAYLQWIRAFVRFHGLRHPRTLGADAVRLFLEHWATRRGCSASTQRQALSALLFLYRRVLQIDLPWLDDLPRPRVRRHRPNVLSCQEVSSLFDALTGPHVLLVKLLYGSGLRLTEALRLRIKDVTTTQIYTHVLNRNRFSVDSPLDAI